MTSADRLTRRLARERAARTQAEQIAESRLRESYDRQRELDLLARVATLSNESIDVRRTYEAVLPLLVFHGNWMTGHVLLPTNDDATTVSSSGIWFHANPAAGARIHAATTGRRFRSGEGLPGLAFRDGPTWESDFAGSTTFVRRDELPEGSACAFPIMAGTDVVAIFEFLSLVARPPDERFLNIGRLVGAGLGRASERSRSIRAQSLARQALESAVEERTRDLVEARSAAIATARARLAFHAALSHELGTPLHALTAALDAADAATGTELADLLTVARSAATDLQARAAQLLRNADAVDPDEAPRIVTLDAALTPSFDAYRRMLEGTGRNLSVIVDGDTDRAVHVDGAAIVRATEAILAAALLATDGGDIDVRLSRTNTSAAVAVAFLGGDEQVPELAAQAADAADGSVTLSGSQVRTEMVLTLPGVTPDVTRRGATDRVLLVDDTAVMRQLCAAMVSSLGHEVDVVTDGAEALAALADQDYGLVLMDLSMPVLDGLSAARLIRAGHSGPIAAQTPVVALTAHTSATHLVRSRLAGMDDLLAKPFNKEQLASVLDRFLPAR